MLPGESVHSLIDGSRRTAVSVSQLTIGPSLCSQLTSLTNDFICEHGGIVTFPHGLTVPKLAVHILHVVRAIAQEQVGRVDTCGIVAGMKNLLSLRNVPVDDHPRYAMGLPKLVAEPRDSVTELVTSGSPYPAGIRAARAVDARPKNAKKLVRGKLSGHSWSLLNRLRGAAPRDVSSIAGALCVPRIIPQIGAFSPQVRGGMQ